jgi:uncharacterized protein YbaR (Trm112 family)
MHRDLLDALRCPAPHEESWLVAMVHRAEGPVLHDVDLACPHCQREFTVRSRVADFRLAVAAEASHVSVAGTEAPDALRLAALLGLSPDEQPTAHPILLSGVYASASHALGELARVPQVLVNTSELPEHARRETVSVLRVGNALPLGVATLDAAALDAAHSDATFVASVVRAVRAKGRLVAPAHLPVPDGVRELARDDHEWVGEVVAQASGLVELRRQSAPS